MHRSDVAGRENAVAVALHGGGGGETIDLADRVECVLELVGAARKEMECKQRVILEQDMRIRSLQREWRSYLYITPRFIVFMHRWFSLC